jgi:hypothetical protein
MIFPVVQRQHRKSDVMTSFGQSDRSAVYYQAGSSLFSVDALFQKFTSFGTK